MRPRTYSIALLITAFGVFALVVCANLLIDPEAVLGTGVLGRPLNANDRYEAVETYAADPNRYDGLLFGSSRAKAFPLEEVSRRMDGAEFVNFGVVRGQLYDHLAVLDYVLRNKGSGPHRLRAVFLLLDADLFGERSYANRTLQSLVPPALSGEPVWRFKWRYLAAIQPKAWWGEIGRARARWTSSSHPATPRAVAAEAPAVIRVAARAVDTLSDGRPEPPSPTDAAPPEKITSRQDFDTHLRLLARFVELCRRHDVRLVVALSPLREPNAAQYDREDLVQVGWRLAALTPVWDFGSPAWLSNRTDLWLDNSHFRSEVAVMMLDRMFGGRSNGAPADFGVLRSSETTSSR